MELTRVKNDINGNPRYVVHFLSLINQCDCKQAGAGIDHVMRLYDIAVKKAHKIGGKKYRAKHFGGGIVFQSYNIQDLIRQIDKLQSI